VADISRAATLPLRVLRTAFLLRLDPLAAPFDPLPATIHRLELERTGERVGFGEAQLERVAEGEALPAFLAD
jgi:hypothetical protein